MSACAAFARQAPAAASCRAAPRGLVRHSRRPESRAARTAPQAQDSSGRESSGSGSGGGSGGKGSGSSESRVLYVRFLPETIVRPEVGPDGASIVLVARPVLKSPALVATALAVYDDCIKHAAMSFEAHAVCADELGPESLPSRALLGHLLDQLDVTPSGNPAADAEEARLRLGRVIAARQAVMDALVLVAGWAQEGPLAGRWSVPPGAFAAEQLAMIGATWAVVQEESSPEELANWLASVLVDNDRPESALASAVFVGSAAAAAGLTLGSWAGADGEAILAQLQAIPPAGTWLAWMAPYVGATLAAHALAPDLACKSILRPLVHHQCRFFRPIPVLSCLLAAAVVATGQCLVYQGMWQQGLLELLGGSRDAAALTDPYALEDSLQRAMGTLVGAPRLPASLLAPSAAVATGLLEAFVFVAATALRRASLLMSFPLFDSDWPIGIQFWRPPPYDEEHMLNTTSSLGWAAASVAMSGAYLALEASLTGSLCLAVCTSAVGLATSMLLSKRQNSAPDDIDSSSDSSSGSGGGGSSRSSCGGGGDDG